MPDLRPAITAAITAALSTLANGTLRDSAKALLDILGYRSDRTLVLEGSKPQAFLDLIASQGGPAKFDQTKALFADWTSADILFQLTDADISRELSLFKDTSVQPSLLQSYLFFAIELKGKDYPRGALTAIARQLNRFFPMPVMVLLKHGAVLSIAVINRRRNKLHTEKDVLEKVTLIRDISLSQPHRGHLDILASFALENLVHPKKLPIQDFDTLHAAWEQIFNIELLNARFYKELSNWYFWALPQVDFPADLEPDSEKRRATGLIRLLTRLVFCWFLKEKDGLIPEKLFHPTDLAEILKGFDHESKTSSTYYQAILQNLFFATLNQRMGSDSKSNPHRIFATDEGFQKNRATYDVNNLYRYESLFAVPQEQALALFADIPFLNGGLFECLDRTDDTTQAKRYLDGFSRNPKKRPHVPDRLFFDSGETTDLSTAYGDKKRKAEKVTGLIHILNRYKFTIVENTPIDQEIALDPELLGKVFENLLASYNEETKTTARKQTGSFYTPRPIVDYMVDESLKAHFARALENVDNIVEQKVEQKVEQTFLSAQPPSAEPSSEIAKTRRCLPHWKKEGAIYWVTFRMADSLPQEKLKEWKAEREIWTSHHPEPWDEETWNEYNQRFGDKLDQWLDAGMGSRALARVDVREVVKSCLLKFDGERLIVHSAVIMPNHVHALIEPLEGHDLSKLLQGIKGASARSANQILGTTGTTFWLDESYDHIVRSEAQYQHFVRYIAENPVKPGLQANEFWLKASVKQTFLSASSTPNRQIGMSASSTPNRQTGMSAPLSERLDHLFAYTEEPHQFSEPEVATLIAAIDALKILDPACGSGAFPMGVLHKLVYILTKLDPDNDRWKATQLAKLDSAPMRDELERAFADNNDDYGRKLYLIENCLYGVDIQRIAIQITKLRFFISLVCDQKTNRNKKDNHGIRPLPNLETKFVAANSLIGLPEMQQTLLVDPRVRIIEKEIESLYHSHFSEQRRDRKLANQRKVKSLRQELAKLLAESLMSPAKSKHVAEWDPFDPQSSADFFDPHWMFGRSLTEGFDIIIGNPPYISVERFAGTPIQSLWQERFETYAARGDVYCFFYERGADLLRKGGNLTFITSNKWMRTGYGEGLRSFLSTKVNTEAVLDFGMAQNFGAATTYTCITRYVKEKPDGKVMSCYATDDRAAISDPGGYFAENAVPQKNFAADPWIVLSGVRLRIKKLVEAQGIPLEKWDIQIARGIITGLNDAFYLSVDQRDALIAEDPASDELIGSLLRGRDVERYAVNWNETYQIVIKFGAHEYLEERYPAVFRHLQQFETQLKARGQCKYGRERKNKEADKKYPGQHHWLELDNNPSDENLKLFAAPKIMYPNMTKFLPFYFDNGGGYLTNDKGFTINSDTQSLCYLTAFLNSHLFRCCFRDNFPELMGNTYEVRKIFVDKIPVKKPTVAEVSLFERLVPLIQFAKSSADIPVCDSSSQITDRNVCATFLEDLIDACVMECYFREHMAERDLLFHDTVAPHLAAYDPSASAAQQRDFLTHLHQTLNAPSHPIRNRLLRLTADSPDLLAIIKQEGKV